MQTAKIDERQISITCEFLRSRRDPGAVSGSERECYLRNMILFKIATLLKTSSNEIRTNCSFPINSWLKHWKQFTGAISPSSLTLPSKVNSHPQPQVSYQGATGGMYALRKLRKNWKALL